MADEVKSIVPNAPGYPEFPASPAVHKATGASVEPGTLVGNPSGTNPGNQATTQEPHPSDVAVNPDPSTIVPLKEPIPVEIHGGTAHADVTHGIVTPAANSPKAKD